MPKKNKSTKMAVVDDVKGRNRVGYAWDDRDITTANKAFNAHNKYHYFNNGGGVAKPGDTETGILRDADGNPVRDKKKNLVIELPPTHHTEVEKLKDSMRAQLGHLAKLSALNKKKFAYPIKLLMPYRLDHWHWNVLEVVVKDDKFKDVRCTRCDTDKYKKPVQRDVFAALKEVFPEAKNLNKTVKKYKRSGQKGVNCGMVAAIMMHDLKSDNGAQVYDRFVKSKSSDKSLRDEVSKFVFDNLDDSGRAIFCKPIDERNFVDRLKGVVTLSEEQVGIIKGLAVLGIDDALFQQIKQVFEKSEKGDRGVILRKLRAVFVDGENDGIKKVLFPEQGAGGEDKIVDFDAVMAYFLVPYMFVEGYKGDLPIENAYATLEEVIEEGDFYDIDGLIEFRNVLIASLNYIEREEFVKRSSYLIEQIQRSLTIEKDLISSADLEFIGFDNYDDEGREFYLEFEADNCQYRLAYEKNKAGSYLPVLRYFDVRKNEWQSVDSENIRYVFDEQSKVLIKNLLDSVFNGVGENEIVVGQLKTYEDQEDAVALLAHCYGRDLDKIQIKVANIEDEEEINVGSIGTPLVCAAHFENLDMIECLVRAGCDPQKCNQIPRKDGSKIDVLGMMLSPVSNFDKEGDRKYKEVVAVVSKAVTKDATLSESELGEYKKAINKKISELEVTDKKFLKPKEYSGIGVEADIDFEINKKCKCFYKFTVTKVFKGSAANKAGLNEGGVILCPVDSEEDLKNAIETIRNYGVIQCGDEFYANSSKNLASSNISTNVFKDGKKGYKKYEVTKADYDAVLDPPSTSPSDAGVGRRTGRSRG